MWCTKRRASYRDAIQEILASDDYQLTDLDYANLGTPVPFFTYLCTDPNIVTSWSLGLDYVARVILLFLLEERRVTKEMTHYIMVYKIRQALDLFRMDLPAPPVEKKFFPRW